ncbi:MAG: hypothetical protein J0L62_11980 [Bacteroidetes bacterium]|nr:hypothetical protein [Bacteroidota bacterium]
MSNYLAFIFLFFFVTVSGCKDNSTEPKEEIPTSPWEGDWVYYTTLMDGSLFYLNGFRISSGNKIKSLGLNTKTGFPDTLSVGPTVFFTPKTDTTATILIDLSILEGNEFEVSRNPKTKTITIENYFPYSPNVFTFSPKEKKYPIPPAQPFSFTFLNKFWSFPVIRNSTNSGGTSLSGDTLSFFFSIGTESNETGRLTFEITGYTGSGTYSVSKKNVHLTYSSKEGIFVYFGESEPGGSVTVEETFRDVFIYDLTGSFQFDLTDSKGILAPLTNGTFKSSFFRF